MMDCDSIDLRKRHNVDPLQNSSARRSANVYRALVLMLVGSIGIAFCNASSALAQTDQPTTSSTIGSQQAMIESVLKVQTKAWNEGDLVKFMQTYWNSDKLTFSSGGKTTYGWQATLDNYKKSYASPKQMGQLHFDGLAISMIEANSALVLGNWHLKMEDGNRRDGNFSLVVKQFESGWKIIHDHSSSLEPEKTDESPSDN